MWKPRYRGPTISPVRVVLKAAGILGLALVAWLLLGALFGASGGTRALAGQVAAGSAAGDDVATATATDDLGLWRLTLRAPSRAVQGVPFDIRVTVSRVRTSDSYRFRYGGEDFQRAGILDPRTAILVGPEDGSGRAPPEWATEDGLPPEPPEFVRDLRLAQQGWLLEGYLYGASNLLPDHAAARPAPQPTRARTNDYPFGVAYTCERAGEPFSVSHRALVAFSYAYRDVRIERGEPAVVDEGELDDRAVLEADLEGTCVAREAAGEADGDVAGRVDSGESARVKDVVDEEDVEPVKRRDQGVQLDVPTIEPPPQEEPPPTSIMTEQEPGELVWPEGLGPDDVARVTRGDGPGSRNPAPGWETWDWRTDMVVSSGIDLDAWIEGVNRGPAIEGSYASDIQREVVAVDAVVPPSPARAPNQSSRTGSPATVRLASLGSAPPALAAPVVSDDLEIHLVATGRATGDAFRLHAVNRSDEPISLRVRGLVLEPLEISDDTREALAQRLTSLAEQGVETVTVTGYCLERPKAPPRPGQLFRVASGAVQQEAGPVGRILAAAREGAEAGLLEPDSDPAAYVDAVTQWAIWVQREAMTRRMFERAFVERTRETFEQAGRDWSAELEDAVRSLVPNRWRDIGQVLELAGAPTPEP